jgi:hypothetical protein
MPLILLLDLIWMILSGIIVFETNYIIQVMVITVERSKVETYLQLSITLFENLFAQPPLLSHVSNVETKIGQFLQLWILFDREFRRQLPPKNDFAYDWKMNYLVSISKETADLWESLNAFRNQLVHGFETPDTQTMEVQIQKLKRLLSLIGVKT